MTEYGWICPNCGVVPGREVTFYEYHEACGAKVTEAPIPEITINQRVDDLTAALRYVIRVRNIKCLHDHEGPDEACAACQANIVIDGGSPSEVVR